MENNSNINLFFLPFENENYWIFKIDDYRKNFLIDIILEKSNEYTIQYQVSSIQKRDFSGRVLFLFFNEKISEWTFEYEGTIKKFEYVKNLDNETEYLDDKKITFEITFNNIKLLNEIRFLDELKYSLKSIKDFLNPLKGIRSNLNKISKVEYDAIAFGEIYYSRTFFYTFFTSLHSDHKLAFYNQIFNSSKIKSNLENDYGKLLPLLQEYIKNNIYLSVQLYTESVDILKKIDQNIDLAKIGFDNVESNNKTIDYLLDNYEYCKEFILLYEKIPTIDIIKNEYSDFNKTEVEFYKIFKNEPFPIELL